MAEKDILCNFEEEQRRIRDTKSYQKMISYLEGLAEDRNFSGRIKKLRIKCHLPENGLTEYIYKTMPINGHRVISHPSYMDNTDYWAEIHNIAKDYGLDLLWCDMLEHYLIYNNYELDSMVFPIVISDYNAEINGPFESDDEYETTLTTMKLEAEQYPVAILVSPYSSQQEIVDYVKKLYNLSIKPIQERYKKASLKIGRLKKRDKTIKERNKFILANKHLSRKKIASLVAEKFGKVLDYTYINKIISDYEKK